MASTSGPLSNSIMLVSPELYVGIGLKDFHQPDHVIINACAEAATTRAVVFW